MGVVERPYIYAVDPIELPFRGMYSPLWARDYFPRETARLLAALSPVSPFTGRRRGERFCEDHEWHDVDCINCVEADSYCPHGHLLLHHFGSKEGMGCWRPLFPDEVEVKILCDHLWRPDEHGVQTCMRCGERE